MVKYEGPESVSAFIAEPVVGATSGALVPRDGYWQRIREICDTYNILLISDEVMVGAGRCGTNTALEHWDIVPDMIVMAKGISSGYTPFGVVVVKEQIWRAFRYGSGTFVHGHTYSMNPLSMAICVAVLKYLKSHNLVRRSREMGEYLFEKLEPLWELPIVGDIRGLGLFCGIEFVKNKHTKESFALELNVSKKIFDAAFERGLLTYPGSCGADGISGDHILIAPPFIITKEQIDELVSILRESIEEVAQELQVG
jgi:adenosylmethionine-8-amino-7-oxononanoate aminotransferase